MGQADIRVLVGVLGNAEPTGASYLEISKKLQQIAKKISDSGAVKVKVGLNVAESRKAIETELKQMLSTVKVDWGGMVQPSQSSGSKSGKTSQQNQQRQQQEAYNKAVKQAIQLESNLVKLRAQYNQASKSSNAKSSTASNLQKELTEQIAALEAQQAALKASFAGEAGSSTYGSNNSWSNVEKQVQASQQLAAVKLKVAKINDQLAQSEERSAKASEASDAATARKAESTALAYSKLAKRIAEDLQKVDNVGKHDVTETLQKMYQQALLGAQGKETKPLKELLKNYNDYMATVTKAGDVTETFSQTITRVFKEKFGYGVMATVAMMARQQLRQVYTNVVNIDTAMTELKKVTDETDAVYSKFLDNAATRAHALGTTIADVVTATADFARLGYSLDEASELADSAAVYKNVGDGITSISEASESIISTMKAFKVEAADAMSIVDKFNEVGNNFAISSQGIGEALLRSASALATANNDLDESIALVTAANSVVQDPDKVGTALKTVSMYLRAAKSDAEEAGESTDGMANSVSELRKELLVLTNNRLDIQLDANTFKSTYQVMRELSQIWDSLTDLDQAAIIEKIGGKRNANVVTSLLQNFQTAEEALETAQNSAGSALKENEKYLDSINGKAAQLAASFERLSTNVLDSDLVKGVLDIVRGFVDALNWLNDSLNGLPVKILTVTAAITAFGVAFNIVKDSIIGGSISKFIAWIGRLTSATSVAATAMTGLSSASLGVAGILAGFAVVGVHALFKYLDELHPSFEQLQQDLQDTKDQAATLQSTLDENAQRIAELQQLRADGTMTLADNDELQRLQHENAELENQIKLLEQKAEVQQQTLRAESREQADAFVGADWQTQTYVGPSGYMSVTRNTEGLGGLQNAIQDYKAAKSAWETEYARGTDADQKNLNRLASQQETALNNAQQLYDEAKNIRAGLDETDPADWDRIIGLDKAIDAFDLLSDDAQIAGTVLDNILSRDYNQSAVQALTELAEKGELTKESLENLASGNEQVRVLLEYLQALGLLDLSHLDYLIAQLTGTAQSASDVGVQLKTVAEIVSELEGPYQAAAKAVKETNKQGYISMGTLSDLTTKYKSLEKYLTKTSQGYQLTTASLNAYIAAQRTEYTEALEKAKKAAVELINANSDVKASYDDSTKSILLRMAVLQEESQAQLGAAKSAYQNAQKPSNAKSGFFPAYKDGSVEEMGKAYKSAQKNYVDLTKVLNNLKKAQENIDNFMAASATAWGDSQKSSSSSSSADKYKQNVEKQIKILKHKLEMDLISQEEYYNALAALEKKYYLDSAAHRKKYEEEIWALDAEIFEGRRQLFEDWLSDQELIADKYGDAGLVVSQRSVYDDMLKQISKQIDAAYAYGLTEADDYVQELRKKAASLHKTVLSLIQDTYDTFISYVDDFDLWDKFDFSKVDVLKKKLKEIDQLYKDGLLSWKEYVEAHNKVAKSLYDTQKSALEEIVDMTMKMIEQEAEDQVDAIEKQKDAYGDIIDLKKKLLEQSKDEKDHESEVADLVKDIAKLQSRISQLSLDDSRDAAAKRAALEEELYEKQKELADLQNDYSLSKTEDMLDDSKDAFEKEKDAEADAIKKSVDSWVKRYKEAISRIDNDWDGLYADLMAYQEKYRDSIDGPDSLKTAWENATEARKKYNNFEDAWSGIRDENALNPNGSSMGSGADILAQMQANSAYTLRTGKSLHSENKRLADQYYEETGQKLVFGKDNYWHFDNENGAIAYEVEGSVAQSNPYTAGTASRGATGDVVKWIQYQLVKGVGYQQPIDGTYWTTTEGNVRDFQKNHGLRQTGSVDSATLKKLRAYHTGGVVDGTGAINDQEVLAILKRGELVLNDTQKKTLRRMIGDVSDILRPIKRGRRYITDPIRPISELMNIAPSLNVNVYANGTTDAEARRCGRIIGDTALTQLKEAFTKRGM